MKKFFLLCCICLCITLNACQGTVAEKGDISKEQEESILQEELPQEELSQEASSREKMPQEELSQESLLSEPKRILLEKYQEVVNRENAKRLALLYLDEDTVPELLILKSGEYKLYSLQGSEVMEVNMPDAEMKVNAYGPFHEFEDYDKQRFYWFEYIPYKGLIRVHAGTEQGRNDYYLRYTGNSFEKELVVKSIEHTWHTYDGEKEISNEEFLDQLDDLGYGELIPCEYLYDNVETAYENIGTTSDAKKVLEDFVNGNRGALDYVEEIGDIPEDGFVMKSYKEYYEHITAGEEHWGSLDYIDFDNDGEEELIMNGYCGNRYFFDVIGDTVYRCLKTGTTSDVSHVAEREGMTVIARTDLTHVGRKSYIVMTYDACFCLVDWFHLYAGYEGETYTADDKFKYRNREISMEEYERIRDSIE